MIDVGCGPGRMVRALQHAGLAVLGIDISSVAVYAGSAGGGQVLQRDLADPLPGEGRWGTALLRTATSALAATSVRCSAAAVTWSVTAG